ncbi:hypothetical protein PIB30_055028 [Stylosanthes scabra]|uniref:Uncharacterized protein n=1 Tax=Stylosanthes scabra TaxID=79078 RepID=A0ABU6SIT8_9FABA|nr:hypothetical protein [Stylosanthes scabra]
MIREGFVWHVGGLDQSIWHDAWSLLRKLGDILPFIHISDLFLSLRDILVSGAWFLDDLLTPIPMDVKEKLLSLPPPDPNVQEAGWYWNLVLQSLSSVYGMYLRGVWDYRRNRWCQDGKLEVYVKGGCAPAELHQIRIWELS